MKRLLLILGLTIFICSFVSAITMLESQTNSNDQIDIGSDGTNWFYRGQSFQHDSDFTITQVTLMYDSVDGSPEDMEVKIFNDNGSGVPGSYYCCNTTLTPS